MKIYHYQEKYNKSDEFEVFCDGTLIQAYSCNVSAYPFNQVWRGKQRPFSQTEKTSFVMLGSNGEVTLEIVPKKYFEKVTVRPLSRNVTPVVSGNTIKVTFPAWGQYSVELGDRHNVLTVFINPEKDFDIDIVDENVIYFGPGVHYCDERIELSDNQTVFIDEGAVLYGSLNAIDKKNIRILGYGILDNSRMKRANEINGCAVLDKNAPTDTGNPIFINRCKDVLIEGITIVDSSGWNIYLDGCDNVTVDNIKLIGMWRYNSDGCDFCNCTNSTLKNSYLRNFDDCVTVKGFKLNGSLPVDNILVENCVLWCDWGRALEVGAETCAPYIRNITFKNCDIIHGCSVMLDVQHGDASDITNVTFEGINIEYSGDEMLLAIQSADDEEFPNFNKMYAPDLFTIAAGVTMWSIDDYAGNISGVYFRNINIVIDDASDMPISRMSTDGKSKIENIYFENIYVNGKACTKEDLRFDIDDNCNNVFF